MKGSVNRMSKTLPREYFQVNSLVNGEHEELPEGLRDALQAGQIRRIITRFPASMSQAIPEEAKKRMIICRPVADKNVAHIYFPGFTTGRATYSDKNGDPITGYKWILAGQEFAYMYFGGREFWVEMNDQYKAPTLNNLPEEAKALIASPQEDWEGPEAEMERIPEEDTAVKTIENCVTPVKEKKPRKSPSRAGARAGSINTAQV
jgi:hypothetical protein